MLDIITVIMHYYFQSGFRSVWCQPNAGSLVELSTWALAKWALCPWLPGMGAWELKASGWAVSQAILAQSSKNTSFSPEAEITALWSALSRGALPMPVVSGPGWWFCRRASGAGRQAGPSAPFNACVAAAAVYCCGASQPLLLLFSWAACKEQGAWGGKIPPRKKRSNYSRLFVCG